MVSNARDLEIGGGQGTYSLILNRRHPSRLVVLRRSSKWKNGTGERELVSGGPPGRVFTTASTDHSGSAAASAPFAIVEERSSRARGLLEPASDFFPTLKQLKELGNWYLLRRFRLQSWWTRLSQHTAEIKSEGKQKECREV